MFGRRTEGPGARPSPMDEPDGGDTAAGGEKSDADAPGERRPSGVGGESQAAEVPATPADSPGDDKQGVVVSLPKPEGAERILATEAARPPDFSAMTELAHDVSDSHASAAAAETLRDTGDALRTDAKSTKFGRRKIDRTATANAAAETTQVSESDADSAAPDSDSLRDSAVKSHRLNHASIERAKRDLQPLLMEVMDVSTAARLPRDELANQINDAVTEILAQQKLQLNLFEQRDLVTQFINDMLGLGPIEPLIDDETISEVMVNGPKQIYIEREGKLILSDVVFHDNAHVMNVATRIVTGVGRRVDESNPICDARLADGSRVNVIVPPLAIDGPTITIRKFKKDKLTLDKLVDLGAASVSCARLLRVISASQCNILISGGTGSGKTTLLNCLTAFIDEGERIITCEDAAELQLQQPHVVRLETRPPNLEGIGQVTMRDLVRNCLRMRPERIIVGEVRGPEAFDLLQAMNTGHDGSMGTVHANNPREAISRIENMIAMGGFNMPAKSVREQVASALDLIIQTQRLRDGSRKVTHVTEVLGMEGEVVTMQDLFVFEIDGEDENGRITGTHRPTGLRPKFVERARYFGLEQELVDALAENG